MENYIKDYIQSSIETKTAILSDEKVLSDIKNAVLLITKAYKKGKRVFTAGNGGSAADAQHIAAELVSKFLMERPALSAIALTTNTSILTSVGNDYNHEFVFARQIQAHANPGDVFIAISTSGNSKNIIKAVQEAKNNGLTVIGLTGKNQSALDELCDCIIKVPSAQTPIIQEAHIMIAHVICALVEKDLYQGLKD